MHTNDSKSGHTNGNGTKTSKSAKAASSGAATEAKPPITIEGAVTDPVAVGLNAVATATARQMFERYVAEARALRPEDVQPLKGDASLAYHNCKLGLEPVMAQIEQVKKDLPNANHAWILDVADVAFGLVYSAIRAGIGPATKGDIAAMVKEAGPLRMLLSSSGESLLHAGLITQARYDQVKKARGPKSAAQQLIGWHDLFTELDKSIVSNTPVREAHILRAGVLGSQLLASLKPKRGRTRKEPASVEALDLRNRFYTLVVGRHRELRRAGMWLWVEDVDQHVPPLMSHVQVVPRLKVTTTTTTTGGDTQVLQDEQVVQRTTTTVTTTTKKKKPEGQPQSKTDAPSQSQSKSDVQSKLDALSKAADEQQKADAIVKTVEQTQTESAGTPNAPAPGGLNGKN